MELEYQTRIQSLENQMTKVKKRKAKTAKKCKKNASIRKMENEIEGYLDLIDELESEVDLYKEKWEKSQRQHKKTKKTLNAKIKRL